MGKFVDKLIAEHGGKIGDVHPLHLTIAMMNDENAAGTHQWQKCPNCGEAFDAMDTGTTVLCSNKCEREYIKYINNPESL